MVITPPDVVSGRGQKEEVPPLKQAALDRGLHVYQPESINSHTSIERLTRAEADLMIVASFGKILSENARTVTTHPAINIHPSLLPEFRGPAPVARTLLAGKSRTGVTFFQLTDEVDAGPILEQFEVDIDSGETRGELRKRLFDRAADRLPSLLDRYENEEISLTEQNEENASYAPFLSKEEGFIPWRKSADQIWNHVRAMQPWPTAYSWLDLSGREDPLRMNVYHGTPEPTGSTGERPGTITGVGRKGLQVRAGEGTFRITEMQPSGGRRMDADDFINGYQPEAGDRFLEDIPGS